MSVDRPWYREPETFIALAALVVSVTAVVVGVYEAALQRKHDVAEVWPHLEISTWISDRDATVRLDNTGLGPGIVNSVTVAVDGRPQRNWDEVLRAWYGREPPPHSTATAVHHALRPGDHTILVGLPIQQLPPAFWASAHRITVRVCYASVFEQYWTITDTLGTSSSWELVDRCPVQPRGTDF
jgi:hypothetical protein